MNGYYRFALLILAVGLFLITKIWTIMNGIDLTVIFLEWALELLELIILVLLSVEMHKVLKK